MSKISKVLVAFALAFVLWSLFHSHQADTPHDGVIKKSPKDANEPKQENGTSTQLLVNRPAVDPKVKTANRKRVEALMAEASGRSIWSSIRELKSEDLESLKDLYRTNQDGIHRLAVVYAMGMLGDDEDAIMFQTTLFTDYSGRTLNGQEAQMMRQTVIALGFLANRSDKAFDLLKDGTDFAFWRFHRTWTEEKEYDGYPDYHFVDFSIQALAISGRSEYPEVMTKLLTQKNADYLWRMHWAIETAAFQYDTIREHGRDVLIQAYIEGNTMDSYHAWKASPAYLPWGAWEAGVYRSKHDGAPLPMPPAIKGFEQKGQ